MVFALNAWLLDFILVCFYFLINFSIKMDWAEDLKQTFKKVNRLNLNKKKVFVNYLCCFRQWKKDDEPRRTQQATRAVMAHRHPIMTRISKKMHCPMSFHRDWISNRSHWKTNREVDGPTNRCDPVAAESMLMAKEIVNYLWLNVFFYFQKSK